MIFKRKTIEDNAKDFGKQYEVIRKIIFYYLAIWFKQIFDTPNFKESKFEKDMYLIMAAQLSKYLLGEDIGEINLDNKTESDNIKLASKHVKKWADDVMSKDSDFCELIVQTIRMHFVYTAYYKGTTEALKLRDGRISLLLQAYGEKIPKEPNPDYYEKLVHKYLQWYEVAKNKGLIDELEKDY